VSTVSTLIESGVFALLPTALVSNILFSSVLTYMWGLINPL
jgi:hypothetical protein